MNTQFTFLSLLQRLPFYLEQILAVQEDSLLMAYVAAYGSRSWTTAAAQLLPGRTGKQCRERYYTTLDPSVRIGDWSEK